MPQSLWPQSISRVRHVATERAARREIERARVSRRIMIEALRQAALNRGGGKRGNRDYVTAPSVKLARMADEFSAELSHDNPTERLSMLQLVAMSKGLNLAQPDTEPLEVVVLTRGSSRRVVFKPGRLQRVRQRILLDLLDAIFPSPLNEFGRRGVRLAWQHIKGFLSDPSVTHFVVADISNFYGSINQDWVMEENPFPERVAEAALSPDSYRFRLNGRLLTLEEVPWLRGPLSPGGWAGLLPGLAISPALAERASARICDLIQERIGYRPLICIYVDDILLAARGAEEAERLKEALEEAVHRHPAGPFRLGRGPSIYSLSQEVPYLGLMLGRQDGLPTVRRQSERSARVWAKFYDTAEAEFGHLDPNHGNAIDILRGIEGAFGWIPEEQELLEGWRGLYDLPRRIYPIS